MTNPSNKPESTLDWRSYWENRLQLRPDVGGTGHRAFSMQYNEYMYLVATENMQLALQEAQVAVQGQRILDVGAGLGYFVNRFLEWGAASVTGVDITEFGVQQLRQRFPHQTFYRADISDPDCSVPGGFDLVSAISMLFHIVEEPKFDQAIQNICDRVLPGGHLLLVDTFYKPFTISARHANPRPLSRYVPSLEKNGCRIVTIRAMYHFFGQTFVPVIGPAVLSLPPVMQLMLKGERWMARNRPRQKGFLQYLVARREG